MAGGEKDSAWEFLNVLRDANLSPADIPYPPPELRGAESDLATQFIIERTGLGRHGGLERGGISTPYWEARKVYGDDTARILLERGREYAENPPDVPQHVLDNVLLPPHDVESAKKWGAPVPVARMEEGYGFNSAAALTRSSSKEDNPHRLPWSVMLPTEGSRYDSDALTAHEFTHAGAEWGESAKRTALDSSGRGRLKKSLEASYKSRIGDSLTSDRLSAYLAGVDYIIGSSREATANLSGSIRNYGSVHGRPPRTEEEVLEAIREDGERRSELSQDEYPDFERGRTDALLGLPWTGRIGKHLVKNETTEGGRSYV